MRSLLVVFFVGLLTGCASVVVPLEKAKVELASYATRDPAVLRERWGYLAAAEGKYLWPDDIDAAPRFRRWIVPGAILEVDEYTGPETGHFYTYRYNPQTKAIDIFSWRSGELRGEAHVNRDGSVSIKESGSATFTHSLSREGVHVVRNVFGAEWTWREIPRTQFLAQLEVLKEDRAAERRRSDRETNNTLMTIAQGLVSAAGTATSSQGSPSVSQSSLPSRAVGQSATPTAGALGSPSNSAVPSRPTAATASAQTPARVSASPGAGVHGSPTLQAHRPDGVATRSNEAADRRRESQQAERTRQEQARRDQARQETAARQETQRADSARRTREYLVAVAQGSRVRTLTCPGGGGKYFVTGTRPRPKPEVVPCVDLHVRARCEGSSGSIPVVAGNFGAGEGCLGDSYAIEPKPACRIEDVRLQVVEARVCGE